MPSTCKNSSSKKPSPTQKPPSKAIIDKYDGLLKCTKTFPCPKCKKIVRSNEFEKVHARDCLGYDHHTQCVWCLGSYTYKRRTKYQHVDDHLSACWDRCAFRQPPPLPPPPSAAPGFHFTPLPDDTDVDDPAYPRLGNLEEECFNFHDLDDISNNNNNNGPWSPLCPERDLFHQSKLAHLPEAAYELFRVLEFTPSQRVTLFEEDNHLNLASSCVRAFTELRTTHDFNHCTVRAVPQFLNLMLAEECETRMLPFSCWCNGGDQHENALHRQHRHMILVHPKGRFDRDFWSKIKIRPEDVPLIPGTRQKMKYYKSLHKTPIRGHFHLIHALAYLSKKESSCDGTLQVTEGEEEGKRQHRKRRKTDGWATRQNHFWIMKSLPREFRLPLMMQWEGGLMQLITWSQTSVPLETLAQCPRQRVRGWQIAIQHLPGFTRHLVLPVAKQFRPADVGQVTSQFLWLLNGVRMYFTEDRSLLALEDPTEWELVQARHGNVFYDAVAHVMWTPRPFRQQFLNAAETNQKECEEKVRNQSRWVESDRDEWKRMAEEKEAELATREAEWKEAAETALRGDMTALVKALKKNEALEKMRMAENAALKEALRKSQAEVAALRGGSRNAFRPMFADP